MLPVPVVFDPVKQLVHTVIPLAVWYVPSAHAMQLLTWVSPVPVWYVPAAQGVHTPGLEPHVPAMQGLHCHPTIATRVEVPSGADADVLVTLYSP